MTHRAIHLTRMVRGRAVAADVTNCDRITSVLSLSIIAQGFQLLGGDLSRDGASLIDVHQSAALKETGPMGATGASRR